MKLLLLCCVAVLLAGCGVPGVELTSGEQDSAGAAATPVDIDAIVAQRQTATAVAQALEPAQPAPEPATPTFVTPSELPATPTAVPPANASPSPSVAASVSLPSVSLERAPAADASTGGVLALGREGTVDGLSQGAWYRIGSAKPGCFRPSAVVGDGSTWLACGETLELTADGEWLDVFLPEPTRFFRDPSGRVWALSRETVQVRENGVWTAYAAADTIGVRNYPIDAMAFGPDGTVWIGGANGDNTLVSFDGSTWKGWGTRLKLERNKHPTALLVTTSGELLAGTDYGAVLRWEGEQFGELISPKKLYQPLGAYSFPSGITELAQTPDGTVWIATGVGLYSWQDGELQIFDPAEGLPGRDVRDIAVDDAGRLWVATTHGIAMREGDGWRIAQPATSDLSASYIVALAVTGAPELPPPQSVPETATVSGRVTKGGTVLGEHDVRLCAEEPTRSRRREASGPCSNMSFFATVKSDAEGQFRFEDVPIGTYFLVARDASGSWIEQGGAVVALEPGVEVRADVVLP